MYVHETKLRVRYGETDQMGYMYYGNYAEFLEVARVEMLRNLGLTYKSFEEQGIMMPVLELNVKYIKPARYDDEINIITTLKHLPAIRIHFDYELFNEQGELLTVAHTKLVFVDMKTNKPCHPPAEFLEKLKPYFNN
ncbi:acyl-CoA thioesterase [Solitalea koreensis]|uniref:Acyl-CoA thioester hydrolase n=1 Tax=Solitalea koreensis TaxID=543615 RepID=A0A521EJH5_9SPHI|nr:thioesterase family protein [Solitalea koreensis]SMO84063.1 acyl-CoA thioester hydrolase [Solitalea koreensis]